MRLPRDEFVGHAHQQTVNIGHAEAQTAVLQVCMSDPKRVMFAGADCCAADSLRPVALFLPC
jgi:hypothetical protein